MKLLDFHKSRQTANELYKDCHLIRTVIIKSNGIRHYININNIIVALITLLINEISSIDFHHSSHLRCALRR